MSVLVGIPAYNESKTIAKIISESSKFGTVVIVDDGSTDDTCKLAKEAGALVISHSKNMGYGKSISDLFSYAKKENYTILVTLDGDGQHNPNEIPLFLKAVKNTDVVIGNRFLGKNNTPSYRKFGIKIINTLSNVGDSQCGFRCFNKEAIDAIAGNIYETNMGASVEILRVIKSNNLKITEVTCEITYNGEKHSQTPLSHGLDVIYAFFWAIIWDKPSRTLLPLGLFFLIITTVSGAQTINLYVQSHYVVLSWALFTIGSIICTMLIFNILTFVLVFKNKKVNDT
jgi:glycosyltransferase involved in cell wall biosynthesis